MDEDEIIESIKRDLSTNYYDSNDEVITDIYNEVSSIASNISNRDKTDEKLYPYVKKAVKAIYLSRGAEGLESRSESGVSSSFEDIIEKLRNDIIKNGLRRLK